MAGHASMPRLGDNALLKLAPVIEALRPGFSGYDTTEAPLLMLEALGLIRRTSRRRSARLGVAEPLLPVMVEPMLCVTLTPTMVAASEKINVIPARAYVKVDCRVPPGLGEDVALKRLRELLGETAATVDIEFTEKVYGYQSPARSELMDAIERWIERVDPGARAVPVLLAGLLGLEPLPRRLPGPDRLRLLPAPPPDARPRPSR